MGALGLNPLLFLKTKDDIELALMIELSERIAKNREMLDSNLAVMIAENVGKLLGVIK